MFKTIAKLFLPSGSTLAGYAADGIADAVNATKDETKTKIARVSAVANEAAALAAKLTDMLTDGSISKTERDELAAIMTPLFNRVLELI